MTSAARVAPRPALRVKSFRYRRVLPHIKHVGTFELFHHRRLAQAEGYDDALFASDDGAISEGSIWNIGFFDGTAIVWPDAPMLRGISMQLLMHGLRDRGIESRVQRIGVDDLRSFRSAFFTNTACAVQPIAGIDDASFIVDDALTHRLEACYAANPIEPI